MHFRARFAVLLFLALALFFRVEISSLVLGPFTEKALSHLFGTKVTVEEFRFDPLSGHLTARNFMIMNQPGFTRRPHFRADLEAWVDMRNLLTPHIHVETLIARNVYFLIEKHRRDDAPWTEESFINIKTWIRRMRELKPDGPESDEKRPSLWKVQIDRIILDDAAFIYDYRTDLTHVKKRYVFQDLKGHLSDFRWPTEDPGKLEQTVYLEGLIGLSKPAPIRVGGKSNFSSSKISFDLDGEIRGGAMKEYKHFWEDLAVKVVGGDYDMHARAVCDKRQLKWENDLVLHKLRLKSKRTAGALIWGFPIKAAMSFLESQEKIELKMPVQGDIGDPHLSPEFGKAFREALNRYTQTGLGVFKEPVKIMAKTGGVITETPVKMMGETFEKMTELVNPAAKEEKAREIKDKETEKKP